MRDRIISKLQFKLQQISAKLADKYDSRLLKQYCAIQKDIEIQKAYQQVEGEND